MKVFDDIKNDKGYYYVRSEFNLNDLLIMIAYIFIMVAGVIAYVLLKLRAGNEDKFLDLIMIIIGITFGIPFFIYLAVRLISIYLMRSKIKTYKERGKYCSAEIIGEVEGKLVFDSHPYGNDEALNTLEAAYDIEIFKKRHFYKPIVKFYENGAEVTKTSKYELNNSYKKALSSPHVRIYLYKDDFIIADTFESSNDRLSIERKSKHINTLADMYKKKIASNIVIITTLVLLIAAILKVCFKYLLRFFIT